MKCYFRDFANNYNHNHNNDHQYHDYHANNNDDDEHNKEVIERIHWQLRQHTATSHNFKYKYAEIDKAPAFMQLTIEEKQCDCTRSQDHWKSGGQCDASLTSRWTINRQFHLAKRPLRRCIDNESSKEIYKINVSIKKLPSIESCTDHINGMVWFWYINGIRWHDMCGGVTSISKFDVIIRSRLVRNSFQFVALTQISWFGCKLSNISSKFEGCPKFQFMVMKSPIKKDGGVRVKGGE